MEVARVSGMRWKRVHLRALGHLRDGGHESDTFFLIPLEDLQHSARPHLCVRQKQRPQDERSVVALTPSCAARRQHKHRHSPGARCDPIEQNSLDAGRAFAEVRAMMQRPRGAEGMKEQRGGEQLLHRSRLRRHCSDCEFRWNSRAVQAVMNRSMEGLVPASAYGTEPIGGSRSAFYNATLSSKGPKR